MASESIQLRVGTIMVVGIVSVSLTLATAIGTEALYYRVLNDDVAAKQERFAPTAARDLAAAQQAELTQYGWVDRGNGVVRVPIDQAMNLVVRDLQARRRAAAPGGS
ncbi:MAG: hypothetical protein KC466_13785 [Myxococcales bacterium]|nr:hypothetical protein [Myxococcales bacterium]